MASHTAKIRAYKTAEGDRVVAEGDPAAATLYCTPGREVDKAEAERLGLPALEAAAPPDAAQAPPAPPPAPAAPETQAPPAPPAAPAAPETKAVAAPPATKSKS